MALQIFATNSVGQNTQAQLSTTDDALIVSGVTVASTNGYAVFGGGDGHLVDVQGTVAGAQGAIFLGNGIDNSGQHVVIGEDGYAATTSTLDAAVTVRSYHSRVDNAGTIHGERYGLSVGGATLFGGSTITNSGLIDGGSIALQRFQGSTERLDVYNSGEMRSPDRAYSSVGQAVDQIFNFGLIDGDVRLGAGNDAFSGTGQVQGIVFGEAGADELFGGAFADKFEGGDDSDVLYGGAGDDDLSGNTGQDFLSGGEGSDRLIGGSGVDELEGGNGDDFLAGQTDADFLSGGAGNDGLHGEAGGDVLAGGTGDDFVSGGAEADQLDGGAGNDTVDGGTGNDTMSGGGGNDAFVVESAGDVVSEVGGSGVDTVSSRIAFSLSDAVHAKGALEHLTLTGSAAVNGTGNALANIMSGNVAGNVLSGLAGNDALAGGGGNDRMLGGLGDDALSGQDGSDRLYGGLGKDKLTGGALADTFVFDSKPNTAANRDVLTDFVHGQDKIWLENAVFAKIGAAGALKVGAFHVGSAAHDANDRIVYNKASGVLSYDADGNGAGAAIQFAVLANKAVLTASDFVVI
jgi:Ca2+-binding RTX toxin-like protein